MASYQVFLKDLSENKKRLSDAEKIAMLETFYAKEEIIHQATDGGETGMFLAVYHYCEPVVRWYLEHGASARFSPNLEKRPYYFTSSILQMALYRGFSPDVISLLIDAGANVHHICEFTFMGLIRFILSKCNGVRREYRVEYIKILMEAGAEVTYDVMDELLEYYHWGNTSIPRRCIEPIIGEVVWNHCKWEKNARTIQRFWRNHRKNKAIQIIQRCVRRRIYNPKYIWGDGQTITERLFGECKTA